MKHSETEKVSDALRFKVELLDRLSLAVQEAIKEIISEENPYYKLKKSIFLSGLQHAIELIQSSSILNYNAIRKDVTEAIFKQLEEDARKWTSKKREKF